MALSFQSVHRISYIIRLLCFNEEPVPQKNNFLYHNIVLIFTSALSYEEPD